MLDQFDNVSRLAIIKQSWRRAMSAGLPPSIDINDVALEDYDRHGRFLEVSSPVLQRMADQLAGTGFTVTLADDSARIVDIRAGSHQLRTQMESIGAALGRPFREATSGTNAIATTFETRRSIAIRGTEHYVEAFKEYSCFGLPIKDPITHRLAGVLNITCLRGDETQLLRPYMLEAVEHIELQLLDTAGQAERQLLAAFHEWNGRSAGASVVAFGAGMLLANDRAQKTLSQEDYITLRAIGSDQSASRTGRMAVDLEDGQKARAEWRTFPGSGVTVFRIRLSRLGQNLARADFHSVDRIASDGQLFVVSGEVGTGKTTTLSSILGERSRSRVHYSELADFNWQAGPTRIADAGNALVVEDIDQAEPLAISHFATDAKRHGVSVFATSGPTASQRGELLAALSAFRVVECAPLRSRRADFASIARSILDRVAPGTHTRIQPQALAQLMSYPWPGNLVELESVLHQALDVASDGTIREVDLPDRYRHAFRRPLTMLEQAERDAIELALVRSEGGKRAAALALGISRSTLYKRLVELDIRPL